MKSSRIVYHDLDFPEMPASDLIGPPDLEDTELTEIKVAEDYSKPVLMFDLVAFACTEGERP